MKTYSEARQAVLFRAAAGMYDVASSVLNDCTEPAEFTGSTYEWARNLAKITAERAHALREEALEVCIVHNANTVRGINAAKRRYSEAVDRHIRLREEWTGIARAEELARQLDYTALA